MRKLFLLAVGLLGFILLSGCADAEELPKFFGIYVIQNGRYVEINRVTEFNPQRYNETTRMLGNVDFNIRQSVNRESFAKVDSASFNKDGFLVVQDPEWSDIKLFRAPGVESQNDDEIVVAINVSGLMGMPFSTEGLDEPVKPIEVELKKAKAGEDAYIYVPVTPLNKGFYLIDYKKNGQGLVGYNPVEIK